MTTPGSAGPAAAVTRDGALVRLRWAPGTDITEANARAAMDDVNAICGDERLPMLVDMTKTASVSRAARTVFTVPCAVDTIALLGRSPVDRVIANFILGVISLPTPTRYFNSEPAALAWLEGSARCAQMMIWSGLAPQICRATHCSVTGPDCLFAGPPRDQVITHHYPGCHGSCRRGPRRRRLTRHSVRTEPAI